MLAQPAHPPVASKATDDFVYQPPQSPYLELLYFDDDIVIANKPSGLLSVPGKAPAHQDSLERRLARVWPQIRVVHRLDMATSGLIIFAQHKAAQSALSKQFQARTVQKRYLAKVQNQLPDTQGSVDLPLRCDWPRRPKQMVCYELGKSALTHYQVLEYEPSSNSTLVELSPVTGRSHQLRVHMEALGCPILGDRLYGDAQSQSAKPRLQLHAQQLVFCHPSTDKLLTFTCPASFD